jgi:excisionase family DNA binding protein
METTYLPSRLQVTIREAAEMLGYCEATIYNMIKRGDIKTVGRRKMRRIPMTEILDWQQRNLA